jgi:sulfoxide reductase catalytic subunit YedY
VLIRKPNDIRPSEITSEANYLNRRDFIRAGAIAGGSIISSGAIGAIVSDSQLAPLANIAKSPLSTSETLNSFEDISTYNNFYEFGLQKGDPVANAKEFKPRPWSIKVSGHAEKTGAFDFDDFMKPFDLEERIYRMRCVEAWSMVIQPTSKAQYVAFETLEDRERMPGQKGRSLDWPYREGLTIAEATNPLAILAVGLYGNAIPNQNGAPIRLVVPWKYGFKGIKSIVGIKFMSNQPKTSWNMANPSEYGFYANVNPEVDHPRWSQARERRIGGGIFDKKRETLMFNGYGEQVAHLYKDLNLRRNF